MWRRLAAAIVILEMLVSSGCLFEPRDPEPPDTGEENDWVVPNSPKDVFLNLASGFASNKDSNYEMSLGTDFTFIPRDADLAQLGAAAFADWTKEIEMEVLGRIKTLYVSGRTVQFGDENGTFEKEDVSVGYAVYEGIYQITLDRGDGSEKETYAGIARFTVEQGTTGYVLTKWEDLEASGSFPTSGSLRGTLRASN